MTRTQIRRIGRTALAAAGLTALAAVTAFAVTAFAATGAKPAGAPPRVTAITLGIRHRVFHEFGEKQTVVMNKRFQIGDTDYSGEVVEFQPDFAIRLNPKRISSRSNEPNNPAFHIIVRENGTPRDTVWAFLNMAPHFAPKSLLAFQILKIEFENHTPVVGDTTSAAPDTSRGHGR